MKRFIIPFFTFAFSFAFLSASAVTATKEYVDRQDAATLQTANEAKAYSVATYNFMNGNTNAWFAGSPLA